MTGNLIPKMSANSNFCDYIESYCISEKPTIKKIFDQIINNGQYFRR